MSEYVWYASYGSNISNERFMCYIKGGKALGALTSEEGCRDSSPPVKIKNILIDKQLYFARSAKRWQDKAVAFIDNQPGVNQTLGRMYLITLEQFEDVVKQENLIGVEEELNLNLDQAKLRGESLVTSGWYGRLLYLGDDEGFPIYTFTSPKNMTEEVSKSPSVEYVHMIASGIKENYQISVEDLVAYFLGKPNLSMAYDKVVLNKVFSDLYKDDYER